MAKQRKEKAPKAIKLQQPDRSGPTEKTLLQFAEERSLFEKAEQRQKQLARERGEQEDDDDEALSLSPAVERFLEAALWTSTLAMVHLTFDVLAMNQYGTEIDWRRICVNAARAWAVFFFLFYPLHPHDSNPVLIPGLPRQYQRPIRQAVFFCMSCFAGCFLIYITNSRGYLYNMKRAPPLGCLWLWSVVELDLIWAALSVGVAAMFLWLGGYDIK